MPVALLTDRYVKGIAAPAGSQLNIRDRLTPGLILKVSAGHQSKSWSVEYRWAGRKVRRGLGRYPVITLAAAREAALAVQRQVAAGVNPAAPETEQTMTVSDLIESYCTRHADLKRTGPKIRRRLTKNIGGIIGGVKLSELHRRDISRALDSVLVRGSSTEAVRVFQDARAMLRWAHGRGDTDSFLMYGMRAPAVTFARDRWLTADEVRTVWAALPTAPMSPGVQNCLRLALVTAQRIGEISGMARSELSLADRLWVIPGTRTKNGREHRVPLSDFALELIRAQWDQRQDYVFPGRRGQPHLLSGGISHAVNKAGNGTTLGIPHFTAHDLRRTAATHMEALGILPFVISHILNHVSETRASVTTRHYQRHSYDDEKRQALTLWAQHLQKIIGGESTS